MRSILVGAAVAMVAMGGPAFGGAIVDDTERRPQPAVEAAPMAPAPPEHYAINETPPFGDVVVENYHSAGAELGLGVASTILTIFYTPVRLVVGVVGAGVGGVEGFLTGGDIRTARSMWRPTVEGDYFIRPDQFDHTEHYQFGNWKPVVHEQYTQRGREPMAMEDHESDHLAATPPPAPEAPAIAAPEAAAPVEPELEDSDDR